MTSTRSAPWTDDPAGGIFLHVHVQPRARRAGVQGIHQMPSGPVLKVALTSPPLEGRANDELADLIAGVLGIRSSQVTLESGHKSRDKRLRIAGIAAADAERLAW